MAHARRRSKLLHPMRWRLNSWSGKLFFQTKIWENCYQWFGSCAPCNLTFTKKSAVVSKTCGSSNNVLGQKHILQRSQWRVASIRFLFFKACENCERWSGSLWSRFSSWLDCPDFLVTFYWLDIGRNSTRGFVCSSTMSFLHSKQKQWLVLLRDYPPWN